MTRLQNTLLGMVVEALKGTLDNILHEGQS